MTLGGVGSIEYYHFSRSRGTGPVEPVKPVGQIAQAESGTPVKVYGTNGPDNKILPGIEMGSDILRLAADARMNRLGEDDLNKLRGGDKTVSAKPVKIENIRMVQTTQACLLRRLQIFRLSRLQARFAGTRWSMLFGNKPQHGGKGKRLFSSR